MSNPLQLMPLMNLPQLIQELNDSEKAKYYEFVNLTNETERLYRKDLQLAGERGEQFFWDNREGLDGNGQNLYRFGGNRWLLFFGDFRQRIIHQQVFKFVTGRDLPLNRELSPEAAVLWLRMNDHPIPSELLPAEAQGWGDFSSISNARLDPDWTPPVLPTSTDASTTNSSETSEALQTHEAEQDEAPPPIAPVVLRGLNEGPVVYGKVKKRLTKARYNIIKALLEADNNLTKDELDDKSGHDDARKILKTMAKQDEDWARAIIMPEGPGTGYGIRKLPPT